MEKKEIAKPFVNWPIPELETLQNTTAYRLRVKVNEGKRLTKNEKVWLTAKVNNNAYFKTAVPVRGWAFDFKDVLHLFWVKQRSLIHEYYATDSTSLETMLLGDAERIVKIQ